VGVLLKSALVEAEGEAKAEGKWLLGRWKAKAEVTKTCNFSAYFHNRSPDEIIREFPSSIVIPHSELVRITINHRYLNFEGDNITTTAEDWPIVIKTGKGEYSLVAKTDPVQQFRLNAAVNAIFGDRLRILF
jgi:hypothetical protein